MYRLRIPVSACLAVLIVCVAVTAAQSNSRGNSGGYTLDLDAETEGSADGGEVIHDLEASGSGQGPTDDEDNEGPFNKPPYPPTEPPIKKEEVLPKNVEKPETPQVTLRGNSDVIMNPKSEDRPTSFFAQPGILAAVIGGAVVGLLCAILVVMFIVYRMRKKDEGSYALGEPKQSPNSNAYSRSANSKEFFA